MRVEVAAIMRNEARYVREWVACYSLLGFDQITIYDNQSTDDTTAILKDYAAKGIIVYRDFPDPPDASPQMTFYADALARSYADWVLFVDADELLVLHKHKNVRDYITEIGRDADCVSVNWAVFGSMGETVYLDELVSRRFTRRGDPQRTTNRHVKSFLRPGRAVRLLPHKSIVVGKSVNGSGHPFEAGKENPQITKTGDISTAQINHYVLKSREEFEIKKYRGSVNRKVSDPDKLQRLLKVADQYWRTHDQNDIEDLSMFGKAAALDLIIKHHEAAPKRPHVANWMKLRSDLEFWRRHELTRQNLFNKVRKTFKKLRRKAKRTLRSLFATKTQI